MEYPCQYCGSCPPIWLAAYEEDAGLETTDQVITACKKYYNCPLVGQEVVTNDAEV